MKTNKPKKIYTIHDLSKEVGTTAMTIGSHIRNGNISPDYSAESKTGKTNFYFFNRDSVDAILQWYKSYIKNKNKSSEGRTT